MRTNYTRTAAVVMAVAAGALAAFALRPATGTTTATLAARNPAVEVRTQVIRRTIHVIRHEPGAQLRGKRGASLVLDHGHAPARTHASGGHGSAHGAGTVAGAAAVATRSSGSHGTASSPVRSSGTAAPVATRSSGSHGTASSPVRSSGTAAPVATRSSGSHGSAPSSGASSHPVTRSSGGGHGHGEDGGDGNGRDD